VWSGSRAINIGIREILLAENRWHTGQRTKSDVICVQGMSTFFSHKKKCKEEQNGTAEKNEGLQSGATAIRAGFANQSEAYPGLLPTSVPRARSGVREIKGLGQS